MTKVLIEVEIEPPTGKKELGPKAIAMHVINELVIPGDHEGLIWPDEKHKEGTDAYRIVGGRHVKQPKQPKKRTEDDV